MSKRFTLTEDHLKLLQHMVIRWEDCEFGAPAVDCKRPYGYSDVLESMAQILKVELRPETEDALRALHREMETALQIVVARAGTPTLPGEYVASDRGTDWKRAL